MNKTLKILIVEDSPDDVDLIERELKRGGIDFTARIVKTRSDYERVLAEFHPDVILSDHSLPQFNSIEAMNIWRTFQQSGKSLIPFILITGSVSEEFAVQTIKAGADDYILKDRLKRLPSSIKNAVEKARLEKERANYMAEIIGQAELMKEAEHLAHFGCWKVDLLTGVHHWSDEAFRIFGFASGEIRPSYENFFRYIHPDDKEGLKRVVSKAISSPAVQEFEYRVVDKDGKIKTLQSTILVKRDANERPYQLIGFAMDISKQKLQTRALEMQNEKLMEIGRVQSHEVRAPLARIMGLIHMIDSCSDDKEDLKTALNYIKESAYELDALIKKIVRKTEDIV